MTAHAPEWQAIVLAHLQAYRHYPFAARRARMQGTAEVRLTVDRQGRVLAARVVRGSGSELLDAEALAVLERAAPLPPPPAILAGARIEVVLPIRFQLRR